VWTRFYEPGGWMVVSDIDDTTKVTMTASPVGILESTFTKAFVPVTGMPELYARLEKRIAKSPWFYLSASPYMLLPPLHDFFSEHYPRGSVILRDASWQNLAGLLLSLTSGVREYKEDRMRKMHRWFPRRKLVCFGDSTQADPETYGQMYREFPGWVRAIFIRRVSGVASVDPSKNKASRFESAFKGVPRDVWYVFDEPEECDARIEKLVRV